MKKINYNFEIGKSFAGINFDLPIEKAIKQLGKPIKTYKDEIGTSLLYDNIGIILSYTKNKEKWSDIGIQTDKLIYEGKNWYNYSKKELIQIIKEIYKKNNYDLDFDLTKIDYFDEEQYDFYSIGVALFFNKNRLTNIALSRPII